MQTIEETQENERLTKLQAVQGREELEKNAENVRFILKCKLEQHGFGSAVVFLLNELESAQNHEGYSRAVWDRLEETKANDSDGLWNRNMWRISAENSKALAVVVRSLLVETIAKDRNS